MVGQIDLQSSRGEAKRIKDYLIHPDYVGPKCTIQNGTLSMKEDLASIICCNHPDVKILDRN